MVEEDLFEYYFHAVCLSIYIINLKVYWVQILPPQGWLQYSAAHLHSFICLAKKISNFNAIQVQIHPPLTFFLQHCSVLLPQKVCGIFGLKAQKTSPGLAVIAIPKPVFCVFRVKIPRTFYFKLTEQSSREKLAEGGFEPEKVRLLYPAPLKKP